MIRRQARAIVQPQLSLKDTFFSTAKPEMPLNERQTACMTNEIHHVAATARDLIFSETDPLARRKSFAKLANICHGVHVCPPVTSPHQQMLK